MEEIIKRCKCGVYLTVNKYRDSYQSINDAIKEKNEWGFDTNHSEPVIDEDLEKRMIENNCLYELQFYPRNPIGFYIVYGTDLQEVVYKANEILDEIL